MASVIRVPKANGPAGEASRMTASEAKNGFGRVLDRVARDGAVVITKHDRPDAVILSIEAYQRLAAPRSSDVDALTAQFDALYERLQQPGTAATIEAVFALSPAELGRIAVERASGSGKTRKPAARRARRARG
jgi:prevent-host-death family protein